MGDLSVYANVWVYLQDPKELIGTLEVHDDLEATPANAEKVIVLEAIVDTIKKRIGSKSFYDADFYDELIEMVNGKLVVKVEGQTRPVTLKKMEAYVGWVE